MLTTSSQSYEQKLEDIVAFIVFDLQDAKKQSQVALDEIRFMFSVAYQLLNRITDLDLILNPQIQAQDQDQACSYGCKAEQDLVTELYAQSDSCDLMSVTTKLAKDRDVKSYVQIFEKGRAEAELSTSLKTSALSGANMSRNEESQRGSNLRTQNSKETKRQPSVQSKERETPAEQEGRSANQSPGITSNVPKQSIKSQKSTLGRQSLAKQSMRILVRKSVDGPQKEDEQQQSYIQDENAWGLSSEDQKSPYTLIKMSNRVLEVRNQTNNLIHKFDWGPNLQKLKSSLQMIITKNLDLYASRRLVPLVRTLFVERETAELAEGQGQRNFNSVIANPMLNSEQQILLGKKFLRNYFEELKAQSYALLKYQNSVAKAELLSFYSDGSPRGQKRTLEQKKFKVAGQMQTFKAIYANYIQSNYNSDTLKGDQIYQNIYTAFHKLYASKIDQKFLLEFIDLKSQKRESKRLLHFLEGAQKQIEAIANNEMFKIDPTKSHVPTNYQEAAAMITERHYLHKNETHVGIVLAYTKHKVQLINYFTNLGKLKAYFKLLKASKSSPEATRNFFEDQIKALKLKLEATDVDLVNLAARHLIKQQVSKKFFCSLGELSLIKCGVKGISFTHVFDYLALALIQCRSQEACWLLLNLKSKEAVKKKAAGPSGSSRLNSMQLASLFKLQRFKNVDKHFNVGFTTSVDSINYDKFHDEMREMTEKAKEISNQFGTCTNLDQKEKDRNSQKDKAEFVHTTAKNILRKLYDTVGCPDNFKSITAFHDQALPKKIAYGLDFSHDKKFLTQIHNMIKDLDKLEGFIFDFVPLSERIERMERKAPPDQQDSEVVQQMVSISSSFKQIYMDEARKAYYKEYKAAFKSSADFFESLMSFDENEYEEQFKQRRDGVFIEAIQALFSINKKDFLNGFNMGYLSLPVEHSQLNNYWSYIILKLYLQDQSRAKIQSDVALIALRGDMVLPQGHTPRSPGLGKKSSNQNVDQATRESQEQLINISAAQASGRQPSSLNTGLTGNIQIKTIGASAYNSKFLDLFNLVQNTDGQNQEIKVKTSLFKDQVDQLNHQLGACKVYSEVLRTLIENPQLEKDQNRMKLHLELHLEQCFREDEIQSNFNDYFDSFILMNKVNNGKAMESVLQGAAKYCQSVRDVLIKEISDTDLSSKSSQLTEFLKKLQRDIGSVQGGLKAKAKTFQDDMAKQVLDGQKRAGGSPSPTRRKATFESKLKENESKVIDHHMKIFAYQKILEAFREKELISEFIAHIKQEHDLVSAQIDMMECFKRYFTSGKGKNADLENFATMSILQKGAKIANAVLSGNIFKETNIYASGQSPGQQAQTDTEALHTDPNEFSIEDDSPEREREGMSSAVGTSSLNSQQRGLNYLVNLLTQLCQTEDQLISSRIIKSNPLFLFSQVAWLQYDTAKKNHLQLATCREALENLVNIFEVSKTPLHKYIEAYEHQSTFVKRDLFQLATKSTTELLQAQVLELISRKGSAITKGVVNKIDEVFCEAALDDEEKTDFSNSQTKIRRSLDQDLRSFREHLDIESNKKLSEFLESARKQQETEVAQSLTSMQLLVRIFYLKQIQQHEDSTFNLRGKLQQNTSQKLMTFNDEN